MHRKVGGDASRRERRVGRGLDWPLIEPGDYPRRGNAWRASIGASRPAGSGDENEQAHHEYGSSLSCRGWTSQAAPLTHRKVRLTITGVSVEGSGENIEAVRGAQSNPSACGVTSPFGSSATAGRAHFGPSGSNGRDGNGQKASALVKTDDPGLVGSAIGASAR
jgi:hypothetical protein